MSAATAARDTLPRAERSLLTSELLGAADGATVDERDRLLAEVVRINMGVARNVASRYVRRGIDEDDLVQVAYLALTRAARDFDASRHDDFLSYAVPTMRGELKKHFRDHGWTVRPPRRIQETQARITRAEGELVQQIGRVPTPSQIATHLGAELSDVIEALAADGCFSPTSLDRPVAGADDGSSGSLSDFLGSEDATLPAAEARLALAPVVRRLSERDRRVLYMRFFEERTQQDIAEDIGVTQMQVSRILARIMRVLRRDLETSPGPASAIAS